MATVNFLWAAICGPLSQVRVAIMVFLGRAPPYLLAKGPNHAFGVLLAGNPPTGITNLELRSTKV